MLYYFILALLGLFKLLTNASPALIFPEHPPINTSASSALCGQLYSTTGVETAMGTFPFCYNAAGNEVWDQVVNAACRACLTFEGRDCQGKQTWQGGAFGNWRFYISDSRSYCCV
jgi:hypothetical protein